MTPPAIPEAGGASLVLRTPGDWRMFFYIVSPMVVTALTASHLIADNLASVITALILAILNPILQAVNSAAKWRTYIYGVLGVANTAAISLGFWTDATFAPWIGVGAMILNTVLASLFTPTSTDQMRATTGKHRKAD